MIKYKVFHAKNLSATIIPQPTEVECFNHGGKLVTVENNNHCVKLGF